MKSILENVGMLEFFKSQRLMYKIEKNYFTNSLPLKENDLFLENKLKEVKNENDINIST